VFLFLPYKFEQDIGKTPWATMGIVAANALVFLVLQFFPSELRQLVMMEYGFTPDSWPRVHTYLTYMFLHEGWLHIIGNMYFLWIFGALVEERLGNIRYAALYLSTGVLAVVAHQMTVPGFMADVPCVGASGAVSGILGASVALAGRRKVNCFYLWAPFVRPVYGTVAIPSYAFLAVWFLGQVLWALTFNDIQLAMPVAFWAHVGGFASGAVVTGLPALIRLWWQGAFPRLVQYEWKRASAYARAGNFSSAILLLDGMSARGMLSPSQNLSYGWALIQASRRDDGLRILQDAFKQAVSARERSLAVGAFLSLASQKWEPALDARECLFLVQGLRKSGLNTMAERLLVEGLSANQQDENAAALLFNLGEIAYERGDRPQAMQIYELLHKLFPQSQMGKSVAWTQGLDTGGLRG